MVVKLLSVVLEVLLFLNELANFAKVSRETKSLHYKRKKEDTGDDMKFQRRKEMRVMSC